MVAVSQLTQSRLSLVLFDNTTNALLNKIPVYAEMSITVELPAYTIHQQLDFKESESPVQAWFVKHTFVLDSINNVIVANVSENDFNAISDKHKLYITILADLKATLNDSETEANKQLLITRIVMKFLRQFEISTSPQENTQRLFSFPLGTLASDHAGYLSYDLSNVLSRFKSVIQRFMFLKSQVSFFVYPFAREDLKIDVLQQGRFTPEVIFGKLPIELPEDFGEINRVDLPSMHNPGLEDWYLSPGSFALNPAFFVGADGCENLYPANFATHEFSFFQIIRGSRILIEPRKSDDGRGHVEIILEVRTGWSLEYLVSWQPLGHTLGQIVYSLPLAPGEIIKIAVLDWSRKSIDSRNEDLSVKEQLVHNTHRDRNISETVDAAMQEWQRGGSFMGGVAGSYGGAGYGISGALGGGYSTSSGDRSVHASTVQQISDSFAQASSSVRELRSTIVIQSDQQEHAKGETRVVANHNHSHALTMLYYEVLRHYKVTTQFMRVRPSLLVQYGQIDFRTINNIVHYRKILESVLIEARYLACFDAVQKLQCLTTEFARKKAQLALQPNLNDANELGEIKLVIKTQKAAGKIAFVTLRTKSAEEVDCLLVSPLWDGLSVPSVGPTMLPDRVDDQDPRTIGSPLNYRQDGQDNVFTIKPYKTVLWADVDGLTIKVGPSEHSWDIASIQAFSSVGSKIWVMINHGQLLSVPANGQKTLPVAPYQDIPADPADLLSEDERCCINKLMNHLSENSFHYQKAVWLQEDPNERANRFKTMKLADGEAIIDLIDNRPIDVLGDYVVFPARKFHENSEELNALEKVEVEKLMTLPTRGVFAEAKLGHCNASEEIDDTRFWDWQTSPIPEDAPGIDNVDVNASKNATANLTPTQLPSSIVNIVTPQVLPEPTGMAGAMNLLGKSDIFRDMSISKEVEDLLEKLADKSVNISEAANKAKEIQQQRGTAASPGTTYIRQTPKTTSPAEAQQEIKVSENQEKKGTITPAEHKDNVKTSIGKMNGASPGSEVTVTIDFKHSISGPLDGEFGVEFIGPIGGAFFTNTTGGVGAGKVTIQTGAQHTIQIKGKRTRLPISLDTIAHIPAVAGNPAFNLDVSNHITKREVPIEANIVATITKGRKDIHITIVAEEVAKDIKITAKVTASGTLKANLEAELGLKLEGIDLGHVSAGVAVETSVGGEIAVEFPVEYKRLTGNVTAPKNELVL
jgi:hypothetical protein